MTELQTEQNPNLAWRNYTKRTPITSCKLRKDDLKRLYKLINEKQAEVRDKIVRTLTRGNNENEEQFNERIDRVRNAFITTVTITGNSGAVVIGHGENFFDSALIPERINTVLYDTSFSPNAILQYTPSDRASVVLDFSRPPLLNFQAQPADPTANNSNWFVTAETESWSTSLGARLAEFFSERATKVEWLHQALTYDILLFVMGLPLAFWGASHLGNLLTVGKNFSSTITIGLYIYTFFLSLAIFRSLFSYTRWIFPKIELESNSSPSTRHRVIWGGIILGVLTCALWDGIKTIF